MAAVRGNEFVISRGEGVWLWDEDGNRYLDGSASLWYCNVGHGRAEIADAVAAQMKQLEAWSIFGDVATPPALELADRLAGARRSMEGAKVFFTTGGGDAIDTAAKLARLYWQVLGQPERLHIISRTNGYHGTMAFGTSLGGIEAEPRGYGPLVPSTSQVAVGLAARRSRDEIERVGAERVAAFFIEPVIGAGGVFPPPAATSRRSQRSAATPACCSSCDSVICGFGRLGSWFGFERFGVEPGPGHLRQGRDERLSPARRRRRLRAASPSRSGPSPAGSPSATARPTPATRPSARRRSRTSTSSSARGSSPAAASSRASCSRRSRRSPTTRSSARCAAAPGALVGVAFDPDALAADPALPGKAYRAIRAARRASCARSARRSPSRRR